MEMNFSHHHHQRSNFRTRRKSNENSINNNNPISLLSRFVVKIVPSSFHHHHHRHLFLSFIIILFNVIHHHHHIMVTMAQTSSSGHPLCKHKIYLKKKIKFFVILLNENHSYMFFPSLYFIFIQQHSSSSWLWSKLKTNIILFLNIIPVLLNTDSWIRTEYWSYTYVLFLFLLVQQFLNF